MPGRPPIATRIHQIKGTDTKRLMAKRVNEPRVDEGMPDAPEWVPAGVAQEWGSKTAVTPWLRVTDEPAFFLYCVLRDQINRLVKAGEEITPAMATAFKGYCQIFGFTPPDRAKMQMPTEEKPANKFAKLGS